MRCFNIVAVNLRIKSEATHSIIRHTHFQFCFVTPGSKRLMPDSKDIPECHVPDRMWTLSNNGLFLVLHKLFGKPVSEVLQQTKD